jgi:hypothetical protein
MTTFDDFATRFPAQVMLPSAGLLLAAACALGMAAFTGLMPGKVANQDVHEAAAHFHAADVGLVRVACGVNCGVVERIRVRHTPRAESVEDPSSLFGNALSVYAGNAENYLASFERHYRLTIRMPDRSTRVIALSAQPQYAVGDQVTLTDSGLLTPAVYEF